MTEPVVVVLTVTLIQYATEAEVVFVAVVVVVVVTAAVVVVGATVAVFVVVVVGGAVAAGFEVLQFAGLAWGNLRVASEVASAD